MSTEVYVYLRSVNLGTVEVVVLAPPQKLTTEMQVLLFQYADAILDSQRKFIKNRYPESEYHPEVAITLEKALAAAVRYVEEAARSLVVRA